jgi:glycogen operon protein
VLGCLIGKPGRARAPLLLLVNGGPDDCEFELPGGVWQCIVDTHEATGVSRWWGQGPAPYPLAAHTLALLGAAGHDLPT